MSAVQSIRGVLVLDIDVELEVDITIDGDPLGELPITRMTLNGEDFRFKNDEQQQQVVDYFRELFPTGEMVDE